MSPDQIPTRENADTAPMTLHRAFRIPVRRILAFWLLAVALAAGPAPAQPDMRTVQVQFEPGTEGTTIRDTITGWQSVAYQLAAEAGQAMDIRLDATTNQTFFTVFGPGQSPGGGGLAGSELPGPMVPEINVFSAALPSSGTYTVLVYQMRNASRQGLTSTFTLALSITGGTGAVVQGDFADGLAGGPDFYEVRAPGGGTVNLRAEPSTGAPIRAALANGASLRNRGCRANEGRRWCRVATATGPEIEGWMAGEFLIEGAGPGAAVQLPGDVAVDDRSVDALVPGTNFHATGMVACARDAAAPMGACAFGVVREGNGNGSVAITFPDGTTRLILFANGTPVSAGAGEGAEMSVGRDGDMSVVTIGSERFEIPDAVIWGG